MGDAEAGEEQVEEVAGEYKVSQIFPAKSLLGTVKELTFYRKGQFDIKAEYAEGAVLPPDTAKELGTYTIAVPGASEQAKKIKVRARLTLHGTFTVESATMLEEEEYEDTVKEKRELPAEEPKPEEEKKEGESEAPAEGAEGGKKEGE